MTGQMDYMTMSCSPHDEEPAQIGFDDTAKIRTEVNRYRKMLETRFPIPEGAAPCWFKVKWFPHDFGSYPEVCIFYNPDNEIALKFALFCDHNLPEKWTDTEVLVMPETFDPTRD